MSLLRAFLLVWTADGDWDVTVHRDLRSAQDAWKNHQSQTSATGVLHVGFDRPDTDEFEALAAPFTRYFLLTAAARYAIFPPAQTTETPCGSLRGMPVFVALEGWGYTCTAEDVGLSQTQEVGQAAPLDLPEPREWLNDLAMQYPDLHERARSAGIYDDDSYWENEQTLSREERRDFAIFRLKWFAGDDRWKLFPEIVRYAPPWIQSKTNDDISLTVRIDNVFHNHNIRTLGDLSKYSESALLRMQNFGRKSLRDLEEIILAEIERGPSQSEADILVGNKASAISLELDEETEPTLLDALANSIDEMKDRDAYILRRRMGLGISQATLQEIGDDIGITRERVRQLEQGQIKGIRRYNRWVRVFQEKMDALFHDRESPLYATEVPLIDHWFSGISDETDVLSYLLNTLCENKYHIIDIDGQTYVSGLSKDMWRNTLSDAYGVLRQGVDNQWTEEQAQLAVQALLPENGRELAEVLWNKVRPVVHFAEGARGERVIRSVGKSANALVEAVLADAETPLHYSELARRIHQYYRRDIDVRRAHNAAAEVGFLFNRGTYGLLKHIPYSNRELKELADAAEDIVGEGPEERQWHCQEIHEALEQQGIVADDRLTPYILNIALRQRGNLADLGRQMWSKGGRGGTRTQERIDIRQAAISVLREAGHPLSTSELIRRITQLRGLRSNTQLFPTPPLVLVGRGMWGLEDRDLPLSHEQKDRAEAILIRELRRLQKGLYVSEVGDLLQGNGLEINEVYQDNLLVIARRSENLAIGYGQYVYLPEWGTSRRYTAARAVETSLKTAPNHALRKDDVVREASELAERNLDPQAVVGALRSLGATWDPNTGFWQLPADDGAEDRFAGQG